MRSSLAFLTALVLSACAAPSERIPETVPDDAIEITMTADGFTPSSVEIVTGQAVCWKNAHRGEARWPASDDHPTHQEYPEFDPQKPVKEGERWCLTFLRSGSWKFHDHLFPEFRGMVIVK